MDIQQAQAQIQEIIQKIKAIEKTLEFMTTLALKPWNQWTDVELQVYIDHAYLSQNRHDLRQEKLFFLNVIIPQAQPSTLYVCLTIPFLCINK
jgi:hypothetical protein